MDSNICYHHGVDPTRFAFALGFENGEKIQRYGSQKSARGSLSIGGSLSFGFPNSILTTMNIISTCCVGVLRGPFECKYKKLSDRDLPNDMADGKDYSHMLVGCRGSYFGSGPHGCANVNCLTHLPSTIVHSLIHSLCQEGAMRMQSTLLLPNFFSKLSYMR